MLQNLYQKPIITEYVLLTDLNIGTLEHLERDWNVLRNRFDFPELTAKSKQNHITNHSLKLTKVQADKLKPIYEWDFKIFGYNPTDFVSSPA